MLTIQQLIALELSIGLHTEDVTDDEFADFMDYCMDATYEREAYYLGNQQIPPMVITKDE